MMEISYAVSGYDIPGSTELFTIYLASSGIFLRQIVSPGYLFLHHFRKQLMFYERNLCFFAC